LSISSIDTTPAFIGGSIFDNSETGRERNKALNKARLEERQPHYVLLRHDLERLGATEMKLGLIDSTCTLSDFHLQLCPPSLEYPLIDAPIGLRYTGGIPRRDGHNTSTDFPPWWNEVVSSSKRIIAVSQGTVDLNWSQLVIPALEAFSKIEDILVVVALGQKGAVLPSDYPIPANSRVRTLSYIICHLRELTLSAIDVQCHDS
jgi:hypothetical protein